MTLFCKCLEKRTENTRIQEGLEQQDITLTSATKFLRRVGLKISEVKMKLGINKIIHYLQRLSEEGQNKYSFINHIEKEESKFGHLTDFQRENEEGNKENFVVENEPETFVKVETSKSFMSDENGKKVLCLKLGTRNNGKTLSQAFKPKQVVTKNALEEPANLCVPHKRYNSAINSAAESEDNYQIIERLQLQNQNLEKCLKNMFNFFEDKKLITFGDSAKDLESYDYSNIVEKLTCNFIDYEKEVQEQIGNLSAKSQLLQETLHNMSISMRIEKEAQNQPENASKSTQTELETNEQLEQLEKELNEAEETLREKQILLFIKDQEIFLLKVMVSDLQKKVKTHKDPEQKPPGQSIKKFFEITGQNLNNSTI